MYSFDEKELVIHSFINQFNQIEFEMGCFNGIKIKFNKGALGIEVEYSCILKELLPGGLEEFISKFCISYECFKEQWDKVGLSETVYNLVRVSRNKLIVDLEYMRESYIKESEENEQN